MNLENISRKPVVRDIFNIAELFNMREIKTIFFLKKGLDWGWIKNMFREKIIFFLAVIEKDGKYIRNGNINIIRMDVFSKRIIMVYGRGERNRKWRSATREWVSM